MGGGGDYKTTHKKIENPEENQTKVLCKFIKACENHKQNHWKNQKTNHKKISMNEALIRARQTIREAEDQRDRALLCCMAAGFSPTETTRAE